MKAAYIFEWTHFDGTREVWGFSDCTRQEAVAEAKRCGWKRPRWWQWWRRMDSALIAGDE
jgi:hypothetical protein